MKISFVVPAYNEEKYIAHCIEGILKELARGQYDAEIIVVNNASSDKTAEVAQSYPQVQLVNEMQKGLSRARQAGFAASSGDLIANIDADTILSPGWIDKVLAEFSQNKKLVALSGPFIYYDFSVWKNFVVRIYYYFAYIIYLFTRSMLQGGNFVIRRSALEEVGGYNLDFAFYGEDAEIARRLKAVGKIKFTLSLPVFSSGRRLAKEGILTIGLRYAINYLWTIFWKKPYTTEVLDLAEPKEKK